MPYARWKAERCVVVPCSPAFRLFLTLFTLQLGLTDHKTASARVSRWDSKKKMGETAH